MADTATGVRELISRLKTEGIDAGRGESEALIAAATAEAEAIRAKATAEAKNLLDEAEARIARETEAALASLRLAARDTVLDVHSRLVAAFERQGRQLAKSTLEADGFMRALLIEIARATGAEVAASSSSVEVRVPEGQLRATAAAIVGDRADLADSATLGRVTLDLAKSAMARGVTLVGDGDIEAGARVRLVAEELEIDLTPDAITTLVSRYLLPRYRAILDGGAELG
jgi:V/A-type H+-transporting ATPase subunit E